VMLRADEVAQDLPRERGTARRGDAPAPADVAPEDADMFAALRAWRSEEARRQAVPPYVIFHDSVLRDVAALRPATLGALGRIKGVGASKLERYGEGVLGVLGRGVDTRD
jgi:ATP-dependent DNA helicase RecQ